MGKQEFTREQTRKDIFDIVNDLFTGFIVWTNKKFTQILVVGDLVGEIVNKIDRGRDVFPNLI